ncbi:MAG TPA: alcohol dehydrogenase catalytic domain-containing protein [Gaiellaceae bacterium]|nr:alcohol dehydrogenase catalytic domain-containing protein [Gaiellaceae bacterium]
MRADSSTGSDVLDARGLVLDALGERPRLQRLTVDPPGPGEVRIRMRAAGLCHTDVSQVRDARFTPILLGHEGAGVVESVGADVKGLTPGDPVLVCWKVPCGRCRRCAAAQEHLCEDVVALPEPRIFRDGEPIGPLLNAGCFADYVVLPAAAAVPITVDLPLEHAALVGCAVATGVGAVLWTARVEPGASVAVFGAGGVGLNVVAGARLAGAARIVAVDPDESRRALAAVRGATETLAPGEPFEPVDYAFEVLGEPAVMEQALAALAPAGELVLVGAAARDALMSFHPRAFLSRQQRITGCIYGSVRPQEHLPQLLAWCADGTVPVGDLVGRRISLDELEDAFTDPANGGVRTVVELG